MTRIVIYVANEEMTALKPLARRLEKKGATVVFSAIKWRDPIKADQVLTLPKYLEAVKNIYAGRSEPITVIENDEVIPLEAIVAPEAQEPTIPVLVIEPVVAEPELIPVIDVPEITTDEIVMTAGEVEPIPAAESVSVEDEPVALADTSRVEDEIKSPRSRRSFT